MVDHKGIKGWQVISIALVVSLLTACFPATLQPDISITPPNTPSLTQITQATDTKAPTKPIKKTRTPTRTPRPTLTPSKTGTALVITDPIIDSLVNQGYEREILQFNQAFQALQDNYVYVQYISQSTWNRHLIFIKREDTGDRIIADFDAANLNSRIHKVIFAGHDDFLFLECEPLGWGDVNHNGKPDIPVTFGWGMQYIGSELHIFEINDDDTVTDLTRNLPGIMSPIVFDSKNTAQIVIDLTWAQHDCIYPPMWVYWIYDWRDGKYVNITKEVDISERIADWKSRITDSYGKPFNPWVTIEPLTQLLIIYDRAGKRKEGWKEYLAVSDEANWPGSDKAALKWLRLDIAHFAQEYNAGQPFTPNYYCGSY